ncbi:MAG: hypothetical protein M3416_03405 [Acidobacteriota bacterium]|nr:hypothetical protein [Acidobacteriota bacterium]
MLDQIHARHCGNCGLTTYFTPVRIRDAAGIMCLTCRKRWVIHHCSAAHHGLGGVQTPAPELLPLLIDFGIKRAFDAFCPGCRQAISVVNTAAERVRPYNPQLSDALGQLGQLMTLAMVAVTAVGVSRWAARQLR